MLRMESSLGKPHQAKVMNSSKENRKSDKDSHPFEYNFEERTIADQHSRLLFTDH